MDKSKGQRHPDLSPRAKMLLGHLVSCADDAGKVALTREQLGRQLGVSVPTIARALGQLLDAGELEVMEKGGGRGQPTVYSLAALRRTSAPKTQGDGSSAPSGGTQPQHVSCHADRRSKHSLAPEETRAAGRELGESTVAAIGGCLEGALDAWEGLPRAGREVIRGTVLVALGSIAGGMCGGKRGALVGAAAGGACGLGLLLAMAGTSTPADEPPAETFPSAEEQVPRTDSEGFEAMMAILLDHTSEN